MRGICFIMLAVLFGNAALAQQDDSVMIRRLADEILVNGRAYENLRVLCKTVGGRLAGSPQMVQAEQWGRRTLEESGAPKLWLQECMVPHWIRGGKDVARFTSSIGPGGTLNILALGNSVGTGAKGITAPVILINNFDDLEAKKDDVKGKIVYYDYAFKNTFIQTFRAYGDAVVYRAAGASRAAKYGAVAVLIRSVTGSTDNNPHTGSLRYANDQPKIPAAAIGLKDADKLARALRQENNTVEVFLRTNAQTLPDTIGHNVIAEITGSEFPDQIITIGGHLDSWDPAEGAHDDGAGCVQSIEVLRALLATGYKPRHSIRVVLFANEENGTRGGLKYAEEIKANGEKPIFALESDEGGFTPRGFGLSMTSGQLAKVRSWAGLLKPYGACEWEEGGGGADIGPLRPLGAALAGLMPDSQRYFDYHHARNDVFENVNKRELELGAVNMAALIYLVDKYGLD